MRGFDTWIKTAGEVDTCNVTRYDGAVIRSFRHKGLRDFFETGSKAGIQPLHAKRLRLQLTRLNAAVSPGDMNVPGWRLHRLEANLSGHSSIDVDGNWRLTFAWDGQDAVLVDYRDYH